MRRSMVVLFVGLSTACGTEKGRVVFANEGASEAAMDLKAGDVAFWTDLDLEYQGEGALGYDVELVQSGATVARAKCNPLGRLSVKTGWTETNLGARHTRHGMGKMDCAATLAKGGATTARARLTFLPKPASVSLKKADLVLKQ